MANSTSTSPARIPPWAKKVLPLLVSALILYYYFHDQDWLALWAATRRANLWLAVAAIVLPQVCFWVLDVYLTERTMVWFHGPFPLKNYFWVRGAIYILSIVNYGLSGGGVLLYLQRRGQISWRKLFGILLFRLGLAMWAIVLFLIPATLAMHYYGLAEKAKINLWVWWALLIFGLGWMIEAWFVWHHHLLFGLSKIVVRDRESEFWTAFRLATRGQWLWTGFLSLAPLLFFLLGYYALTWAFDVKVPFWLFMALSPLAMLIVDLPIAFSGFGTATLAWMTFFGDYGSPEDIAALSLFLPMVTALCRALIGLVSLRPALADLATLSAPAPASQVLGQAPFSK